MTPPMRWSLRLYPRPWRARYGAEFEALLEQTGPCWRDFANVVKGALDMQLRTIGFWKLAAAGAILGGLLFTVRAWTTPVRYVSSSVIAINVANPADAQMLNDVLNRVLARDQLTAIIAQRSLYSGVRPTPELIGHMRRDINVRLVGRPYRAPSQAGPSSVFTVSFQYSEPKAAAAVNADLVTGLARGLSSRMSVDGEPLVPIILDPPSIPEHPVTKPLPAMLAMGSALGAALAALAYGLFRFVSTFSRRAASQ